MLKTWGPNYSEFELPVSSGCVLSLPQIGAEEWKHDLYLSISSEG